MVRFVECPFCHHKTERQYLDVHKAECLGLPLPYLCSTWAEPYQRMRVARKPTLSELDGERDAFLD